MKVYVTTSYVVGGTGLTGGGDPADVIVAVSKHLRFAQTQAEVDYNFMHNQRFMSAPTAAVEEDVYVMFGYRDWALVDETESRRVWRLSVEPDEGEHVVYTITELVAQL